MKEKAMHPDSTEEDRGKSMVEVKPYLPKAAKKHENESSLGSFPPKCRHCHWIHGLDRCPGAKHC